MRPGFLHTCLVSLYFLITSAASPRDKYRDRDRDAEHLPEVRTPDLSKEPTCDELRAMWRFSKRQSRAAESTNEIPTYRDPFAYNVWEDQATLRSVGGGKLRRPYIYGRLVHSTQRPRYQTENTPERIRALEELARLYGTTAHVPKVHGRRRPSTYRLVGGQGLSHAPQQTGSFQHLKELIQSERARELHEQKMSEDRESALQYQRMMSQNQHPQLEAAGGRSRPQLEGVVAFPDLTGLAPSKYDRDTPRDYTNLNYMQRSYPDSLAVAGLWQRSPSGIVGQYQQPALAAAPEVLGPSQVVFYLPEAWTAAAGSHLQPGPAYQEHLLVQPHRQSPVWKRSTGMVGEKEIVIKGEDIPVFKRQHFVFERPLQYIQPVNEAEIIGDARGIDEALENKAEDEDTDVQQKTNQQMVFFKNSFDIIKNEDKNDTPSTQDVGNNLIEKYTPGDIERYLDGEFIHYDINMPFLKRINANPNTLNFNKPKLASKDDQHEISKSDDLKKVINNKGDQNNLEGSIYNEDVPFAELQNIGGKQQNNDSDYTVWHDAEAPRYIRVYSEHAPQQEPTETSNNLEQIITSSEGKKMWHLVRSRQVNENLQVNKDPEVIGMPKMIEDERNPKLTQDQFQYNENPYLELARYVSERSTHFGGGIELEKLNDDEDQLNLNDQGLYLQTSYNPKNADGTVGKYFRPEELETSDHLQRPRKTADDMIDFNPYRRKITYYPTED